MNRRRAWFSRRFFLVAMLLGVIGGLGVSSASGSHTPSPSSVTIAGSLQSELGCPGDWQPECLATHLTYDASDDVWQGTFLTAIPAGSWEYKAALNDSWDENYGLHATPNGASIPLSLASASTVKFYYDHKSQWVTDNHGSVIATAPGSFQSELGCPGDWDPGCLRSWLEDPDGDGIYSFETTGLPAGNYEVKAAINESWDENYGLGGAPDGANIPFTVPADNAKMTFVYDATTHVLEVLAPFDPAQKLVDLRALLASLGLAKGTATSLDSKLASALAAVQAADSATACDSLTAFLNHVQVFTGKKLTSSQAAGLTAAANEIRSQLGC